jgi:ribose transport system ATP-binding protein
MLTSPRVLLAEQPTQGVDVGAKIEIYSTLREIAATGSGVVAVSSSNAELAGLCDRVLVMSRGSIVAELEGDRLSEASITDAVLRASVVRSSVARPRGILERIVDSDRSPLAVVIALIIALGAVAQLSSGFYLSERNIGGVLALACVLIIVSLGQSLVIMSGGIDLSVGPLMGLVTVIGSYYLIDGLPPGWAMIGWVAIAVVSVAVGVLNWTLVTVLRIHPMLATLATYMLLQAVGLLLRPTPGGLISSSLTSAITERIWILPIAFLIAIGLAFLVEWWISRTHAGKSLRAAGTSLDIARLVGGRPERSTLLAYVGCSLLAGVAGIALLGMVGTGDAGSGTIYTLQSVAAAVVGGISIFGGRGSFVAVLGAAVLLTQVRSVTTFLSLNDAWQNILLSIVMFGAVVVYSLARRRLVAGR